VVRLLIFIPKVSTADHIDIRSESDLQKEVVEWQDRIREAASARVDVIGCHVFNRIGFTLSRLQVVDVDFGVVVVQCINFIC
jgi:hypothetical protein